MKTCATCKETKTIDSFSAHKARKDGLQGSCKPCMKEYKLNHYNKNKDKVIAGNYRRRQANTDKLWEYKNSHSCVDCGYSNPKALEFDHISDDKLHNIADMLRGHSWESILAEISKCVIVCANCHRIRTHDRGRWIRNTKAKF